MVDEVDTFRSIVAKRRVKSSPRGTPNRQNIPSVDVRSPAAITVSEIKPETSKETQPTSALSPEPTKKDKEGTKEIAADQATPTPTKVRFNDKIDEKLFKREPGEEEHEIIQPPPFNHPPPFTAPETNIHWHVFVSVVKTPADFTVRLLGEEYSDQYEQLQRDMQNYYEITDSGQKLPVPSSSADITAYEPLLGNVYAARAEECWHRVYLNEVIPADEGIADEGVMASVYFIDHGDYETVPLDDLRILEQAFMRLPCQAAPVCLAGFENLGPENFTPEMIDRFRSITLAKIMAAKQVGIVQGAAVGDSGPPIGPYLLLLAMPSIIHNPPSGEAAENADTVDSNLLVNEVMMQMMPKKNSNKTASVIDMQWRHRWQNYSADVGNGGAKEGSV